jgi:hypothetical protein
MHCFVLNSTSVKKTNGKKGIAGWLCIGSTQLHESNQSSPALSTGSNSSDNAFVMIWPLIESANHLNRSSSSLVASTCTCISLPSGTTCIGMNCQSESCQSDGTTADTDDCTNLALLLSNPTEAVSGNTSASSLTKLKIIRVTNVRISLVDISKIAFTLEKGNSQYKSEDSVPMAASGVSQKVSNDRERFDALFKSTSSKIQFTKTLFSHQHSESQLSTAVTITEQAAKEERIPKGATEEAAAVETLLASNLLEIIEQQNLLIQSLSSKLEILEKKLAET